MLLFSISTNLFLTWAGAQPITARWRWGSRRAGWLWFSFLLGSGLLFSWLCLLFLVLISTRPWAARAAAARRARAFGLFYLFLCIFFGFIYLFWFRLGFWFWAWTWRIRSLFSSILLFFIWDILCFSFGFCSILFTSICLRRATRTWAAATWWTCLDLRRQGHPWNV